MGPLLAITVLLCGCSPEPSDDSGPVPEGHVIPMDADGDGFSSAAGDCDDGDASVHPGAEDGCDGVDQDCDGEVDEDGLAAVPRPSACLSEGEIVITEFLQPRWGEDSWFELHNTLEHAIDLAGVELHSDAGSETVDAHLPVEAGGYAVFSGRSGSERDGYRPDWIVEGLDFEGDGLLQLTTGERTLVELSWEPESWQGWWRSCRAIAVDPAAPAEEREDPDHWCWADTAYGSCDDGEARAYGSPGRANEACTIPLDDFDADGHADEAYGGDDCDDEDAAISPSQVEDCDDGLDQDCDDLVDCEDSDCACTEPASEDCSDGVDNDGDGLVDCEDGDCAVAAGCAELDCTDGLDDDGDGLVDCDDDDCWGGACHPAGVQAHVRGGRAQRTLWWRNHVERRYLQWSSSLVATGVSGTVRVLPASATSWSESAVPTTCTWTLTRASERMFAWVDSRWLWGAMSIDTVVRSGLSVEPGCRLHTAWFLPEQLRVPDGRQAAYAGYNFHPAGASNKFWSPWYTFTTTASSGSSLESTGAGPYGGSFTSWGHRHYDLSFGSGGWTILFEP